MKRTIIAAALLSIGFTVTANAEPRGFFCTLDLPGLKPDFFHIDIDPAAHAYTIRRGKNSEEVLIKRGQFEFMYGFDARRIPIGAKLYFPKMTPPYAVLMIDTSNRVMAVTLTGAANMNLPAGPCMVDEFKGL